MKPARLKDPLCEGIQKAAPGRSFESPQLKPLKRTPGTGKGIWMAPDFDAPLADFAEYR